MAWIARRTRNWALPLPSSVSTTMRLPWARRVSNSIRAMLSGTGASVSHTCCVASLSRASGRWRPPYASAPTMCCCPYGSRRFPQFTTWRAATKDPRKSRGSPCSVRHTFPSIGRTDWSAASGLGPVPRRNAQHRLQAARDVLVRRGPGAHADAHRHVTLPVRGAAPAGAVSLQVGDDAPRGELVREAHQHLVEHHVVEHRAAGTA